MINSFNDVRLPLILVENLSNYLGSYLQGKLKRSKYSFYTLFTTTGRRRDILRVKIYTVNS